MEAIVQKCAGLDVHLNTVVVCVLSGDVDKRPTKTIREFSTTTKGLLELLDFLTEKECTQVAMESTGVYWKPVWNILESGDFELIVANARKIRNVPGRKTDIKDAEWIAKLLRCGLVAKSFVPNTEIRDLRYLTRHRKSLCGEVTREVNRIHKVLQDANIKLSSVISDIFGKAGNKVLVQIMEGYPITQVFVNSLYEGPGGLKASQQEFYEAINGKIRPFHREMLKMHYNHIRFIKQQMLDIELKIEAAIEEYEESIVILDTIPGINRTSAAVIIAEIGNDMNQFSTAKNLSSWAGLSPGNNESAGKKKAATSHMGINT